MISLKDLVHISLRQVFRQRKRNFGIILAIALGTAGLISIMAMGDKVKKNLNRDLDLLGGATLIKVSFEDEKMPGERVRSFDESTLRALRELPGVDVVSRSSEKIYWFTLTRNGKSFTTGVQGVDEWSWPASNLEPAEGALLDAEALEKKALVCVIGKTVAEFLSEDGNAVGDFVRIQNDFYRIIGVVDGLQIGDRKKFIFIPITTAHDRGGEFFKADRLYLRCKTWDDVGPVAEVIPKVVAAHQDARFLALEVSWAQLKRLVNIVWWVELFIYLSIGATLTLGGFGIWNGMMSSVTARTREIGLKKAMGAEPSDIMGQFLCESLCLSISAAAFGVVLAYVTVTVTSHFLGSSPSRQVFISYTGMSLAFSIFLGLVAGYYPALRASKMDPVTAIRYE